VVQGGCALQSPHRRGAVGALVGAVGQPSVGTSFTEMELMQ
jgi:hypothetical protein